MSENESKWKRFVSANSLTMVQVGGIGLLIGGFMFGQHRQQKLAAEEKPVKSQKTSSRPPPKFSWWEKKMGFHLKQTPSAIASKTLMLSWVLSLSVAATVVVGSAFLLGVKEPSEVGPRISNIFPKVRRKKLEAEQREAQRVIEEQEMKYLSDIFKESLKPTPKSDSTK